MESRPSLESPDCGGAMSNVGPSASVGRFAVLGPGGVGGLLAALLARSGSAVTCLAEASTTQAIATAGIRVASARFGDFVAPVAAAERLSEPVDVCLVTVKATQLLGALDRLPPDVVGSALIVPLLNGVEHVELLRQHYPAATVVASTIRVKSSRTAPGVIRHDSPFVNVELAVDGSAGPALGRLADTLERAGVAVDVSDDAATVMWSKLTFLTALALLTTAAQAAAGEVRGRCRDDLVAMVGEVAAVARAEGAAVRADDVVAFFDAIPTGMRSSMQRDAESGRRLELDAIGGAVVRAAGRPHIAVSGASRDG